jgi:nucleoside-diphosphate-sugar epimerase
VIGCTRADDNCYAVAKIAGIKLAEAYRREYNADFLSVMPTNLFMGRATITMWPKRQKLLYGALVEPAVSF